MKIYNGVVFAAIALVLSALPGAAATSIGPDRTDPCSKIANISGLARAAPNFIDYDLLGNVERACAETQDSDGAKCTHELAAGQAFAIAAGFSSSQLQGHFLQLKLIVENAAAFDAFADAVRDCKSAGRANEAQTADGGEHLAATHLGIDLDQP
jgi:hypothetical protein